MLQLHLFCRFYLFLFQMFSFSRFSCCIIQVRDDFRKMIRKCWFCLLILPFKTSKINWIPSAVINVFYSSMICVKKQCITTFTAFTIEITQMISHQREQHHDYVLSNSLSIIWFVNAEKFIVDISEITNQIFRIVEFLLSLVYSYGFDESAIAADFLAWSF